MAILKIKDENGNWIDIPAITGTPGRDGKDGIDGKDGKDGYTPIIGVDYFTKYDIEELNKKRIDKCILIIDICDTPPTVFEAGDKYCNLRYRAVYTAIDDEHWSDWSEDLYPNVFYVNKKNKNIYYYNIKDNSMVSVGGGVSDYDSAPVGAIYGYASLNIPIGYMLCDGRELNREEYSELFSVIGTNYGAGDSSTTFNLPNFQGKSIVGYDEKDNDFNSLGATGGNKTHIQTIKELAKHSHTITNSGSATPGYVGLFRNVESDGFATGYIGNTGEGAPMNIMNPYTVGCYIIKVSGTAILNGNVIDSLIENSAENTASQRAINSGFTNLENKIKSTVLWNNPNPSAAFTAQDINLFSDDYDYLKCFYYNWTGEAALEIQSVEVPKGYNFNLCVTILVEKTVHYGSRPVKRKSDTVFSFKNQIGIASVRPSEAVSDNTWAVPIKIVGCKYIGEN